MAEAIHPDQREARGAIRRLLVADGNRARGQRLVDACTAAGYRSKLTPHGAAAIELALASKPALIVAQQALPLVDALQLAEILRANPRTQSVRFLFLGSCQGGEVAAEVGDRVLPEDAAPEVVLAAIDQIFERQGRIEALRGETDGGPVQGDLALLPLADLLQSFMLQRRSGRLDLESDREGPDGRPTGCIRLREGEVVNASVGAVEGEKALFRLLAWTGGRFLFRAGAVDDPSTILVPTRRLLVEGVRQAEEGRRRAAELPPLSSTIELTVKSSDLPNIVHPLTQEVLLLLELYRSVAEVVDHCSYPDYQVLRTLHTLNERGIVRLGPVPAHHTLRPEADEAFFNELQARRLREWMTTLGGETRPRTDAKLLVVTSAPEALPAFEGMLAELPGVELADVGDDRRFRHHRIHRIGRLAVDDEVGIEFLHLPTREGLAPFWPVAGYGALGVLYLLRGSVSEAMGRVRAVSEALERLPRARSFNLVLLAKGERIDPDELRENIDLTDTASLFLLPVEGPKEPAVLLRSLFARVIP